MPVTDWEQIVQSGATGRGGRNGGIYEEKEHDRSSADGKYVTGSLRETGRDEWGERSGSDRSADRGGNTGSRRACR